MAQMNRGLAGVDTLFMPNQPGIQLLASSLVKEIAKWGGDVSSLSRQRPQETAGARHRHRLSKEVVR